MERDFIQEYVEAFIEFLPTIAGAIATLVIGFWIANKLVAMVNRILQRSEINESLANFLGSVVGVGIKIMILLAVGSMFGVATTSFIAVFSAVAFAIGMALQGNLGHLASGIMLMLFKPFRVGDVVNIGGATGKVLSINAFNTVLKTPDNRHIYLPNGTITSDKIVNISGQGVIGVDMLFGIGYSDDIDKARKLILEVASTCPFVDDETETMVMVRELADSSVNFIVRPWCESQYYWEVWHYMHEHVKKTFDANGIGIPFPQMDVHLFKDQ